MAEPKTAQRISSFAAPTAADIAYYDSLPETERRELLRAEIDKGFVGGLSDRSFDEIIADARARFEARGGNG
jgi:hypothetical protein